MKRIACSLGLAILISTLCAGRVRAQESEHLQVGVFADYFRTSQTDSNSAGVGARLAYPIFGRVKLEGEMSYDFDQVFTEGFTNSGTGTLTVRRSDMRILHGEFGPQMDFGHGRIRPFVFAKGGFLNYNLSHAPATVGTAISSIQNLRSQNMNGVFYPGAGLEGHIGPVGLRLDIGDEMYFNGGARNNLRVSFGPFIRF
jgi:hypothetical protein